jgi:hypothetical protein
MAARARDIIDFRIEVTGLATKLHDRPMADILAAELLPHCQDMASSEGLSKVDSEKEIDGDLYSFFRRKLITSEIERDGSSRSPP